MFHHSGRICAVLFGASAVCCVGLSKGTQSVIRLHEHTVSIRAYVGLPCTVKCLFP